MPVNRTTVCTSLPTVETHLTDFTRLFGVSPSIAGTDIITRATCQSTHVPKKQEQEKRGLRIYEALSVQSCQVL